MKLTCTLCANTGTDRGDWNGSYRSGRLLSIICPDCQSADQNAEAAINEATLDYSMNAFGQVVVRPKGRT